MTPCSPLGVNRRFGGTYRLHLQGRKNKFSKKLARKLNLFLRPWRLRRYVPPKRRLTLNGLHGVISQTMILFITTAVKTSNPTWHLFLYGINIGKQPQVFQLIGKRGNRVHCHRVTLSGDIRNPLSEATIAGTLFSVIPWFWTHLNKHHCQNPLPFLAVFFLEYCTERLRDEAEDSTKHRQKLPFRRQTSVLTDRSCRWKRSSHIY
jgi:hypothetical protein